MTRAVRYGPESPCSVVGAVMVGAGHARMAAFRAYPFPEIDRARTRAFEVLAEHVAGGPVERRDGRSLDTWHRITVQMWSEVPGRTAAEAAAALRAAAATARGGAQAELF